DSRRVMIAIAVLVALLFSKQLYVSSLSSYYIFYLIDKFGVSTQAAQLYLFIFLAANAVGAFFGGPLGDRFGRKYIIWISILGALPLDRKSTRLNSSHDQISYAVFCLK